MNKIVANIKIEKNKGSLVGVVGEIPFAELEKRRDEAIKNLSAGISIKGFRKDKAPRKILIDKIGDGRILEEMANIVLRNLYPSILIDNNLSPVTAPRIIITKLASGNPLEFRMEIVVMPEFELPDYKKLVSGVKKEEVKLDEKEVEKTIEQILESKKGEDGKKPEMTDELAQSLGNFRSVDDLKKKIEEGVKIEKERQMKDKRRVGILESIIKETDMDLPELIIESELQKMVAQFKGDVERMQMKWEDYLEKAGKTEDDMRKEWRADAEKRAKSQLVLNKIAIKEELVANEKEVEDEVGHILSHHPKANRDQVRIYAEQILTNEKVFRFLEQSR